MKVREPQQELHDVPEGVTLPILREIISTRRVSDAAGRQLDLHSQISVDTGVALQRFVRELNATTSLEIGLAYGTSALFICQALAELPGARRHVAVDPCQHDEWWMGIGLHNLRRAGFEGMVDFRELPSHQAIPDLEREGTIVDFAFIDGVHTFDYSMIDMFLVDRVLRVGGVMVIDDAEWPGVRKAIRYFVTNRGYEVLECWGEPDAAVAPATSRLRLRRWARGATALLPPLRRIAKPEIATPDESIGLIPDTRCVAVRKTKDDDLRGFFGHEPF